ncbi:MAG: DUF547 domain-containing protein [Acidobacteria bacterium]|jgi:hypothetical protein|nr:DUF547 domain-containing protein [Acidobacteriota bacterium]
MLPLLTLFALVLADPAEFDRVLAKFVLADGRVRYAALRADLAPLTRYVEALAAAPPPFPTRQAELAYWINAYNALVLHSMAADYPGAKRRLTGAVGRAYYFYGRRFRVGGRSRSLADLENNTIRKFGEPRIHFAIVCASVGCPWLAPQAYTGENLEELLEKRTRLFFSQERNFRLEGPDGVRLSAVFDWFREDFPAGFVERYHPEAASRKRRFFAWDWSLNEAP